MQTTHIPNSPDFDLIYGQTNSKFNTSIKLTESDSAAGMKIYCKENYAQDLYEMYSSHSSHSMISIKDFSEGQLCTVIAKSIDFDNKLIVTYEKHSKSSIFIPFRDFSEEPSLLVNGDYPREFKAIITKVDSGEFYASEKQCAAISYRDTLNDFLKNDKWFYVKVISLVKGGYLALYKGTVKCFLPGSHAAANVIRDFNDYLNTEIPVMIENYDSVNDLYIISYKKYIKHTLPQKVYDLEFGKKYTGILTNKPYEFGIFIEFQNYYTGLLHKSEFANYIEDTSTFKSGDVLDFYIKDIIVKKGEPRIILTNDLAKVDQEKITWQKLKNEIEGQTLNFVLNKDNFFIEITIPETNEIFKNDVNHLKGKFRIPNDGEVKILKVDTIRKTLKLDFINA